MVFKKTISDGLEIDVLDSVNAFIKDQYCDKEKTFHKFEIDLPDSLKPMMRIIKEGTIKYQIQFHNSIVANSPKVRVFPEITKPAKDQIIKKDVKVMSIDEMNELYVSSIGAGGSDKVFETDHLDGPFFFLPWCKVYRCIVCLNENRSIYTSFPTKKETYFMERGDFLVFDYNRDVHSIHKLSSIEDNSPRNLLKLHYIVYPANLPMFVVHFYMYLHSNYNKLMRFLFVNAQLKKKKEARVCNTFWERTANCLDTVHKYGLSYCINWGTIMYCWLFTKLLG
jgi:hypothetical protein